jgi:hypothetical protein
MYSLTLAEMITQIRSRTIIRESSGIIQYFYLHLQRVSPLGFQDERTFISKI